MTGAVDQYTSERSRLRKAMNIRRAEARELEIPPIVNLRRRRKCAGNPELFMHTYFPRIYYNPFTENQREMIQIVMDRIHFGGWHAKAAPRGDGKTQIIKGLTIYSIVEGLLKFIVLLEANGDYANWQLDDVKTEFENNDLLLEDYPEVCWPIRSLEGAPQRANGQTVGGRRTNLRWSGNRLIFARVPGSKASGSIIVCRGIDAAIRGMVQKGERPDMIILNDLETRDSVLSESETLKREKTIEQDVVGLAGPGRQIPIVFLCTIMRRDCLADRFTNPAVKPAWHGKRAKFLIQKPDRADLWEKYIDHRQQGQSSGDLFARRAHKFYVENRPAMDAGAIVSNPYRFDSRELPDGSRLEISALEHAYNKIADIGQEAFDTEYQNDPPVEEAPETAGLTVGSIINRTNGLECGVVPAGIDWLTAGIDIGGRQLHYAITAWRQGVGSVIDYGVNPVNSPLEVSLRDPSIIKELQAAILTALVEFRDWESANGWPDENGHRRHLDCCLVDSGWQADPVYEFVRTAGGRYRASKGFGSRTGQERYRHPTKKGHGRRLGHHWFATREPARRVWVWNLDDDYWKQFVHTAFLTPAGKPGSLTLHGADPIKHRRFGEHITAEVWTREFRTGRGYREYWNQTSRYNHWLDATKGACAAAAVLGMKILAYQAISGGAANQSAPPGPVPPGQPSARPAPKSLAQMRGG